METLRALLHSRKVLIAVFAVVAKLILVYVPNFPPELWTAIEELAMVLIAAIAIEDAAEKFGNRSRG